MPASRDGRVPVALVVSNAPLALHRLSTGERARLETLPSPARRHEWLVGRRCLKAVMARLGLDDDTAEVTFPHPSLSVSHSGATAVAVGTRHPAAGGVDVETKATLRPEAARFFLTDEEQTAAGPTDLLRLWTTKEALFKANPANHGTVLRDYVVAAPRAWDGRARGPHHRSLRYRTMAAGPTWITVAITERSC